MKNQDGLSATAYPSGIAGVPVEVIEFLAPIVIHKRELRMDSGGPGEFRGGLGQTMEIEVLSDEDFLFSGLYERTQKPAPGLSGGLEAPIGRLFTNNDHSYFEVQAVQTNSFSRSYFINTHTHSLQNHIIHHIYSKTTSCLIKFVQHTVVSTATKTFQILQNTTTGWPNV